MTSDTGARNRDIGTAQASIFKSDQTGKCRDGFGRTGEEESALQVGDEAWIFYSGTSIHMTPSADCMVNYREFKLKLRIAHRSTRSIEIFGDIPPVSRPRNGFVTILSTYVTTVPDCCYPLFHPPVSYKTSTLSKGAD